jgi:hypothetical protein
MHKIIRQLNALVSCAALVLALLPCAVEPPGYFNLGVLIQLVVLIAWTVSAICLVRADSVWSWFASLLSVTIVTLASGIPVLAVMTDIWRFQYGDRTVHIDPSTHGIPLIGFSIVTLGSVLFLLALLSLPAWRACKHHDTKPCVAPNGDPAASIDNACAPEKPPSVN